MVIPVTSQSINSILDLTTEKEPTLFLTESVDELIISSRNNRITYLIVIGRSIGLLRLIPGVLPNLTSLDSGEIAPTRIEGLEHLARLTSIDLKRSRIRTLSDAHLGEQLTSVDVSHTDISKLADLHTLKNLYYLDISFTSVSSLAEIESNDNLTILDIASTMIRDLTPAIRLPKIAQIRGSHLDITQTEVDIRSATLETLQLQSSVLPSLEWIGNFENLSTLEIAFSYSPVLAWNSLPSSLVFLDIRGLQPDFNWLCRCKNLITLRLTRNVIAKDQETELRSALPNCKIRISQ